MKSIGKVVVLIYAFCKIGSVNAQHVKFVFEKEEHIDMTSSVEGLHSNDEMGYYLETSSIDNTRMFSRNDVNHREVFNVETSALASHRRSSWIGAFASQTGSLYWFYSYNNTKLRKIQLYAAWVDSSGKKSEDILLDEFSSLNFNYKTKYNVNLDKESGTFLVTHHQYFSMPAKREFVRFKIFNAQLGLLKNKELELPYKASETTLFSMQHDKFGNIFFLASINVSEETYAFAVNQSTDRLFYPSKVPVETIFWMYQSAKDTFVNKILDYESVGYQSDSKIIEKDGKHYYVAMSRKMYVSRVVAGFGLTYASFDVNDITSFKPYTLSGQQFDKLLWNEFEVVSVGEKGDMTIHSYWHRKTFSNKSRTYLYWYKHLFVRPSIIRIENGGVAWVKTLSINQVSDAVGNPWGGYLFETSDKLFYLYSELGDRASKDFVETDELVKKETLLNNLNKLLCVTITLNKLTGEIEAYKSEKYFVQNNIPCFNNGIKLNRNRAVFFGRRNSNLALFTLKTY